MTAFADDRQGLAYGPFLEFVDCVLCHRPPTRVLHREHDTCGDLQIMECDTCGLIFTNPRPNALWSMRYRSPEWNPDLRKTSGVLYDEHHSATWHANYLRGLDRLKAVMSNRFKGRPTLIDVGCGSGYFLKLARDAGFDVLGIEPFSAEAKHARDLYNVEVVCGESALGNLKSRYDVATMWNVLEHSRNPVELVREVRRVLRPGGVLLIEVPNMLLWRHLVRLRRWLGRQGPGLIPYEHLHHFTPRALAAVLSQAGFEPPTFHFTSSIPDHRWLAGSLTSAIRKFLASSRIPSLNIYFPIVAIARR